MKEKWKLENDEADAERKYKKWTRSKFKKFDILQKMRDGKRKYAKKMKIVKDEEVYFIFSFVVEKSWYE